MKQLFCLQEERIAAMLARGDPELLEHATICGRCRDIVFALEALQGSRASTMMSARPVSSGYLWWRAHLRRQSGVVEEIARPVVWAETLALILILGIVAGIGVWQRTQLLDVFSSTMGLAILVGLTAILCVGGLTLFLADRRT